ncbi:hypothetical protein D9757_001678 [Collybiopsis confluens]|uniref:Peptidase S9 prolyl oligopeptidase catalytic domain-containing protein n=1 Tax=Collybiopsis confluens TaxID=2823264 RepID=A0A8H5HYR7_9AGAR|nr:hypothetical protein D9757_001678 [Collybiopsis confluens]
MWSVQLSDSCDVLGPFPIHAREQHFLNPAFPVVIVGSAIDGDRTYPSAYADGGTVAWTKTPVASDGALTVVFPDSVRWKTLRDTEGWAALQHHAILRSTLTVYPSGSPASPPPKLRIQLDGASFFAIIRQSSSNDAPRWYAGNIYGIEHALPRVVDLDSPHLDKPTTYDIFLSGDYEIRLFGDPRLQRASEIPAQSINIKLDFDHIAQVAWESTQDVVPDFVDGWAFGEAIGIGLRTSNEWWSIHSVWLANPELNEYLTLSLSSTPFRLAPTQARILPLRLTQHKPLPDHDGSIGIKVTLTKNGHAHQTLTLDVSLSVTHLPIWDRSLSPLNPVIKGSYFFGASDTMPTNFLAIPPRSPGNGGAPILALHGAGVDILAPSPAESFWAQALPRQDQSWVVIPSGRTSWVRSHSSGANQSVVTCWLSKGSRLARSVGPRRLENVGWDHPSPSVFAICCVGWRQMGIPLNAKAIVVGHSNGGQGAWYTAGRFPDRVLGIIAASAYIKSQSYVPWSMSHSAHFADPFLEAILQTSLTPDDNDLFLTNIQGMDVLAIHGADDGNVPVWHSRALVAALKNLQSAKSNCRVEIYEVPGQGHWFPSALNNKRVQDFIDQLSQIDASRVQDSFMLTVAVPAETSSLGGWHVEQLFVPGRLGRVSVKIKKEPSTRVARVLVETTNILQCSVDPKVFRVPNHDVEIWIDGKNMHLQAKVSEGDDVIYFKAVEPRVWKLNSVQNTLQLSGRIQSILSFPYSTKATEEILAPIVFVVPDSVLDPSAKNARTTSRIMSIALRFAHDLHLHHQIDSEIILTSEVDMALSEPTLSRSNIVVIGNEAAMGLQDWSSKNGDRALFNGNEPFFRLESFLRKVGLNSNKAVEPSGPELQPGQGLLFLHPHPISSRAKMLLLQSTDDSGAGLERAARLFPIRTGIPVPDWIIVGDDDGKGEGNVIAAGLWNSEWNWNAAMSWTSN